MQRSEYERMVKPGNEAKENPPPEQFAYIGHYIAAMWEIDDIRLHQLYSVQHRLTIGGILAMLATTSLTFSLNSACENTADTSPLS